MPLNIFGKSKTEQLTQEQLDSIITQLSVQDPIIGTHVTNRDWVLSQITNATINGASVSATSPLNVTNNNVTLATNNTLTVANGSLGVNGNNVTVPFSNVTGVVVSDAQINDVNAGKVNSGVLNIDRIPDIPASKVTGEFNNLVISSPNNAGLKIRSRTDNAGADFSFIDFESGSTIRGEIAVGVDNTMLINPGVAPNNVHICTNGGNVRVGSGSFTSERFQVSGNALITGNLTVANGTLSGHAVNRGQLDAAIAGTQLTFNAPLSASGGVVSLANLNDTHIASLSTSKLTGLVQDNQIANIGVGKIVGQVQDAQIANINSTKIIGLIQDSQVAGLSTTKLTGQIQDSQIANVAAAKVTGQVQDVQLVGISAAKVTGPFSQTISVSNTTASTSSTTGALTVTGGVGIGGNTFVNGELQLSNSNQGVVLNAADRPLITRGWDPFTSGNFNGVGRWGVFMLPGSLTVGLPNLAGGGRSFNVSVFNADSTIHRTWFQVMSDTGNTIVSSTTASTSTTTGALTVAGGVGIAGNLTVGGTISASSLVPVLSTRPNAVRAVWETVNNVNTTVSSDSANATGWTVTNVSSTFVSPAAGRFTIPKTGMYFIHYRISGNFDMTANGTSSYQLIWRKFSGANAGASGTDTGALNTQFMTISTVGNGEVLSGMGTSIAFLNSGDVIYFQCVLGPYNNGAAVFNEVYVMSLW